MATGTEGVLDTLIVMSSSFSGSQKVRRRDTRITVVIPTLGREILRRSLLALERGTVWPARVVVVDQGRSRQVSALLSEVKARGLETVWVPSSGRGRARGVNEGLACVRTPFVAITDDDCLVREDWIERIGWRLRRDPSAIVTGRVLAAETDVMLYVATDATERVQRRPSLRFDRLSGGNMAADIGVLGRLGGLDEHESVRTAEDVELAYRALRAGVPIVYAPELVITHIGWRDEEQRLTQYRSYARSQGGFYGKYLRRGDLFILLRTMTSLTRALRRWVRGVARGEDELARNGKAYVTGLIPGIVAGWRRGVA